MRLPNDSQRVFVCGMTGSGKTQAMVWQLSERSYDQRPWIVYDFKGDELINAIPHAIDISLKDVPKKPGVYRVHPVPEIDNEAVELQMWKIWERGRIGVFVDEGYMIAKNNAGFLALLTQGRSLKIPMITGAQRPVWLSRFVISEADFYQIFFLNNIDDVDTIQKFVPDDLSGTLPRFHSYYYDVAEREFLILKPVPEAEKILDTFDRRSTPRRKFL